MPGLLFPSIPFPSEMSQRHPGTRIISVDLGIREGFLSSCPSCLWKKGWKLPTRSHRRVCDLCSRCSPTGILVALLVLTKNAGIYEPSSFDPFGWIYQHSLVLLIKEKNLFLGGMSTEGWNRTLPRCCNSARVSWRLFLPHAVKPVRHCFVNLVLRGASHKVSVLLFSFKYLNLHITVQWIIAYSSQGEGRRDKAR